MKISTKGIYGLTALIDLALYSSERLVTLKQIAERQNLSLSYLEQIFPLLKKATLVKSCVGIKGGYKLAEDPNRITVRRILDVLEGNLSVASRCINKDVSILDKCLKKYIWEPVDNSVTDILNSLTLQDLVDKYKSETQKN